MLNIKSGSLMQTINKEGIMKKLKLHIIAATALLFISSEFLLGQTPVYISSYVEDTDPLIIEMSFNLSLANIVPASSAFTARVNTDPRGINSVSVSGNKVLLTLLSPVIHYGDVVTIDYNTPPINPLQTSSGERVMSFALEPVINNCLEADIDGNNYSSVEIGRQVWMRENLKVTRFNDSKPINFAADNETWANFETLTTSGYCWYDDNPSNKDIYGALYNWYAASISGLCPSGWHVSSDDDWKTLEIYLGMSKADADAGGTQRGSNEGAKLKENGLLHWESPNYATNESNFTALGAGERAQDLRGFFWLNLEAYFWSQSSDNPVDPWCRRLENDTELSDRLQAPPNRGFSVRCLSNYLKPTLTTLPVIEINSSSASSGGINIDEGGYSITVRGVCWSTSHNPTILDSHTINGSGSQDFTSALTGLTPSTTYYVKAFTFNTLGPSYGNEVSFTTACPIITINTTKTDVSCNGMSTGSATAVPTGGTGPYSYYWNSVPVQTTAVASNLSRGNFTVLVTDANGCTATANVTIAQPELLTATAIVNTQTCSSCNDASINLAVSGGTLPNSFAWIGPDGYSATTTTPTIASLKPGSYSVVITDAHSCTKTIYADVINPFVVTNVNDDGIGSLRYAINYANTNIPASADLITFDIPLGLQSLIQPASALPGITQPLVIDGYTQHGASLEGLTQRIEIEGTNAGGGTNGLTINSNNCTVKGLIIDGFSGNGIQIASGTGNTISANSIYNNGKLGIDIGTNSAVNPNDTGDGDTGPNNGQNYPVLTAINFSPGFVTVNGTLNSNPLVITYRLEFFANKLADELINGEGQTYLGSGTVTTNGGNATFTVTLQTMTKYGDVITATATDPSGNTSEFSAAIGGLQNQILAGSNIPFHYKINDQSVRNIDNATICKQIQSAFSNWSGIATSAMSFSYDLTTPSKYASASDKVNLVSFKDDKFPFSPGVLAVTAKTLNLGATDTEAQIIDADIIFNPFYVDNANYNLGIADNTSYSGFFDIQSIATHEIGHILGLLHSGVYNSTMWFEIGQGTIMRSLEQDDKSWLSYRYPNKSKYDKAFGSISGNIKYGYNNDPVAGAIVLAVNPATDYAVVHAYSDVNGNYLIPAVPPGSYRVYIMPLDGDVYGRNLQPGNISPYIYSNTIYTDYPGEFYNNPDLAEESNVTPLAVTVTAGKEISGINFFTNKDVTRPTVTSVAPAAGATGVSVLPDILIKFSEPVDMNTLTDQTCYLTKAGSTDKIGGKYQPEGFENRSDVVLFTIPQISLDYVTGYTLHITTGVTDLKTNAIGNEYTSSFTTGAHDDSSPAIKSTIPEDKAPNVFLTDKIMVFFSEPMIKTTVESSFALTTYGGALKVDCAFGWDEYSTFILTPKSPLLEGKNYSLAWTNGATDLSGNPLTAGSVVFSTIPAAAPSVTYLEPGGITPTSPTDLINNVAVETAIVADFSEPIDVATVNSTTFRISLGSSQVTGTFEFLNDNSRVVFRPNSSLTFGKTYTIELTNGIQDVSQVKQSIQSMTKTFTTATKPTKPHIEYIDPPAGNIGSEVIISGSGFDPIPANNKVTFTAVSTAGVNGLVTSASLSTLTVRVPYGAVSGAIRVTSNNVIDDQDASNLSTYFYVASISDPCNAAYGNVGSGSKPRDAALDYDGVNAYVTNSGDNTVSVITNLDGSDPTQGAYLLTSIQVGTTPMKISINPTGTRAYVTNFDSRNVSVIDLTDANGTKNEVVKTINVGVNPYGIVTNGDKVYVANYGSNTISIINADPTSGGYDHAVANINTGTKNRDVDITPDGGILLVTGENGLTIIKLMETELGFNYSVSNANSGTSTRNVSVTTDGGTAIVTTMNGDIFFVDISAGDNFGAAYSNTNTGTKSGDGKTSYDGLFYYVTNPDNDQVTVYKITYEGSGSGTGSVSSSTGLSLKEYTTIAVGNSPEGLAIDPGNDRLIVANSGSDDITSVYICCPDQKTASDLIKDLIFPITEMMNGKDLQRALGVMLIGKLNDASNNIMRGKTKTAINSLKAFINKVKEIDAAGKFPQDDPNAADNLIKIAEQIIYMLEHRVPTGKSVTVTDSNVDRSRLELMTESRLVLIYPNPFNQSVTMNYQIGANNETLTKVQITIYDMSGRLVRTLVNETMQQGSYTITWDGSYESGGRAPFGNYIVRLKAGSFDQVRKIVFVK
jgi:uncharacterized protein (TIGR02145 family)